MVAVKKLLLPDAAHKMTVEDIADYLAAWPREEKRSRIEWLLNQLNFLADEAWNEELNRAAGEETDWMKDDLVDGQP